MPTLQQITVKDEGQDGPQPTTHVPVNYAAKDGTQTSQLIIDKDEGQEFKSLTTQLTVKDAAEDWPP